MKNGKNTFIVTEIILGTLVIVLFFLMVYNKNNHNPERIAVIVPDADESQWAAFKYGLKMASQEYDVDVVVISKDTIDMAKDESEVINQEIKKGADAVIVKPIGEGNIEQKLKQIQKKVPVMLIGDSLSQEGDKSDIPLIEPQQYNMGADLVKKLLQNNNGNLKGKKIGLVTEFSDSKADLNRKKGVCDTLKDTGAEILWSVSKNTKTNKKINLQSQRKVDIILALDDKSLIEAGQAAKDNDVYGAILYGIGNSTEAIYYLDSRWVQCLVVPDEFTAGYNCVTEIVNKLRSSFYTMKSPEIPYTILTKDTLFLEKNQDLLFTISQ